MADKKRNKDNKCECASIIKTPKHWQEMELIKTTTAYGNEVMIPKKLMKGWEGLKELHEISLKEDMDMSIVAESFNYTTSLMHERRNALLVFYEKYQKE